MNKKCIIIFCLTMISNILLVATGLVTESDVYRNKANKFDKYGFMLAYSPVKEGYSAKLYGLPKSTEFNTNFSFFSIYIEREGNFAGGEFDDSPLEFWVKEDKDIHRKYIFNLGVTQGLIPSNHIFLAYYAGIGYYEEFKQYHSAYGNEWYINNENEMIGDIGMELIGRISSIHLGLGVSYQSLYYFSAGFEF